MKHEVLNMEHGIYGYIWVTFNMKLENVIR